MAPRKNQWPLATRFERSVVPEPNSGCHLWTGANRRGYGIMRIDGRIKPATHVALELANRKLLDGEWALHHCDNPSCVNPAHLFSGDRSDNARDALRKGRAKIPPQRGRAKKNPGEASSERRIHFVVADHLRRRAKPSVVWFHVPNAPRSAISGAILKRMGMRAGASDFILLNNGEFFALELKAPGGRPTESQLKFQSDVRNAGGHAVVAEGLDEALACLTAWEIFR